MKRFFLAAILALFTACGGGDSGSSLPPSVTVPDGEDNVMALGNVGIAEGALYNDIAISGRTIYGCTSWMGLRVININNDYSLSTTVESAPVPEGKGCRTITTAPDGAVYVAGQVTGGGSWVARVQNDGKGTIAAPVSLPDSQVQSLLATDSHVVVTAGDTGIVVFKRSGNSLTQISALSEGFDQAMGATLWNDTLLVADGLSGIARIAFADPTAPAMEDHIKTFGTARRIQVRGDVAYVAQVAGGVSAYDLTAANPFPPLGYWETHGSSVDLALSGENQLLVANFDDVAILDTTDPSDLQLIATERAETPAGLNPRIVAVHEAFDVIFAAEWSGIWSFVTATDRLAADIHLYKSALDFGIVTASKKGKGILIQNLGSKDLEITNVVVDHPLFTPEVDPATLKPQEKGLLSVNFEPENNEAIETHVTLYTNDPDEPEIRVPITANSSKYLQLGSTFDADGGMIYTEHATGNETTVQQKYAGQVVILAYFGSS